MTEEAFRAADNSEINFQKVCRLCLSEDSLENIFDQNELCVCISKLLSIVVSQTDEISHWICLLCRIRLQEFGEYQARCMEVQEVLLCESTKIVEDENDVFTIDTSSEDEMYDEILITPQGSPQPTCSYTVQSQDEGVPTTGTKSRGYTGKHITCDICGKRVQRLHFEDHHNVHLGLRPYKCERGCKGQSFTCKYKRQMHYRKVHDGVRYECSFCNHTFGSRQGLFSHKQRHHIVRTYDCNLCDKTFLTDYLRKRHKMAHKKGAVANQSSNVSWQSTNSNASNGVLYENFGKTNSDGYEV